MAPRSKKQYGVTPWGQRLRARLTSMGGRIERGEALARTGKVFDTVIRGGRVKTRVKGSSSPYYTVGCRWPATPEAQRAAARAVVAGDALLAAELASGNLPVALLDALEEAGVALLPADFGELAGECDCPDNSGAGGYARYGASVKAAGDPCKHQAALFFEIIGELDKNPQTLLTLRGMSVDMLLGVGEGASVKAKGKGEELSYPLPVVPHAGVDIASEFEDGAASATGTRVSFPQMSNSSSVILQTLQPKPLFSKDDFLDVLKSFYASLSDKKIQSAIGSETAWEKELDIETVRPVIERANFVLSIADTFSIRTARVIMESDMWCVDNENEGTENASEYGVKSEGGVRVKTELVKEEDVIVDPSASTARDFGRPVKTPLDTLGSIPFEEVKAGKRVGGVPRVKMDIETFRRLILLMPGDGTVGSESYRFFFSCVRASLLMLASSNFVPDVVPLARASSWTVFYRPFSSSTAVEECMSRLESVFPRDFSCVRLRVKGDADASTMLNAGSGVLHALCALLTGVVLELNINRKKEGKRSVPSAERAAFFDNEAYSPLTLSDRSNGIVVKRWLSVFGLLSLESEILLKLEETEKGNLDAPFKVELMFRGGRPRKQGAAGGGSAAFPGKGAAKQEPGTLALLDPSKGGWQTPGQFMSSGSRQSQDVVKFVVGLKHYFPEVKALLGTGIATIDSKAFQTFIREQSSILRALGTSMILPRGIKEVLKPRLVTELSMQNAEEAEQLTSWRKQYLKLADLLSFNYRVLLGDELVDVGEFEQMVRKGRDLFVFKGKFIELDPQSVANILAAKTKQPPKVGSMELLRDILSGNSSFALAEQVEELIDGIRTVQPAEVPPMRATLRNYQVAGYQWILSNLMSIGGCALLDDMGLGKTLQSITVIKKLKEDGYFDDCPAIVVCPTSLLSNWSREFSKFAPDVDVRICSGAGRSALLQTAVGAKRKRNPPDVLIMSYGAVRTDIDKLAKAQLRLVVLDEAQAIKNHKTSIAKACQKLGAVTEMRLALTGTVVENRLSELHACFEFILPTYLGKLKWFSNTFAKPIEKHHDEEALAKLKRMTSPFMLRRVKTDPTVVPELPKKIVCKQHVTLSTEQVALYESVREEVFAQIESASDAPSNSGIRRQGLILKLLTNLKQICNHPAAYGDRPDDASPDRSAKSLALLDLLDPIISCGQKVLVFSQYVKTCRLLEKQIAERFSVRPLVFEGSLSPDRRDNIIRAFDRNPARQVLILSLKAGGVGLNLIAASNVIFFDRWWNPAVEEQATDRAFRIGQKRNVIVTKLICSNTFEDRIDAMIEAKREITQMTIGSGENWIGKMSNDELRDLFALSSDADLSETLTN